MKISRKTLNLLIENYIFEGDLRKFYKDEDYDDYGDYSSDSDSYPEIQHDEGELKTTNIDGVSVRTKSGVDLSTLSTKANELIKAIFEMAKLKGFVQPVITSGFRGPKAQARVMYNNWKRESYGSGPKGTSYLVGLYKNKKLAQKIGDSFAEHGDDLTKAVELLKTPISNHNNNKAFDLRLTKDIDTIMEMPSIKALYSTGTNTGTQKESDHWHVLALA
tara:strand:- start:4706 stop:5362 length:657 start_codon:yes stop_codon:yes gene_type:complete